MLKHISTIDPRTTYISNIETGVMNLFELSRELDNSFESYYLNYAEAYFSNLYHHVKRDKDFQNLLNVFNLKSKMEPEFRVYVNEFGKEYILPLMKIESKDKGSMYAFYCELLYPYFSKKILSLIKDLGLVEDITFTENGRQDAVVSLDKNTVDEHYRDFSRQRRCINKNNGVVLIPTKSQSDFIDLTEAEAHNFVYFLNKDFVEDNNPFTLVEGLVSYFVKRNGVSYKIDDLICLEYLKNKIRYKLQDTHNTTSVYTIVSHNENKRILGFIELQKEGSEVFWINSSILRTEEFNKRALGNYALYLVFRVAYLLDADTLNLGIDVFPYKKEYNPFVKNTIGIESILP